VIKQKAQEKIMVNLQATFGELVRLNRFFLGPEESGQHASSLLA